jgi:Pregnancy-associated plasma protein-A/Secretion system C-terminal sorting domain
MYKVSIFILFLFAVILTHAREEKCGTWALLQRQFDEIPGFREQFDEQERLLQQAISDRSSERIQAGTIYTIPVVVHVVYNTPEQNISDAQIQSQITVLNNDYRFLNSDKLPSGHPFFSLAGDVEIEFCLATKDPSNNNTNGIVRKSTTVSAGFTDDDKVKHNGTGGDDAWDPSKYMNIWVCKMKGDLLGYATFPGGPAGDDGVVIGYDVFGTIGTLDPTYNKGRTTTHEVGHWLNLYHIWADEDLCFDDDDVNDTPQQAEATFGCPSGTVTDMCQTSGPGIMYMNFMDYTDDACMNTFTHGQVTRMRASLLTQRTSITTSNKCGTPSSTVNQPDKTVRIYPNPVTNYLFLENLPQTRQNKFTIQIVDELGRVVREENYGMAQQQVEVSELLNGYYVLRVFNDEFFSTQKILVLH